MFFKRLLDIAFSLLAVLALSPLMLFIALSVKASGKGPVFFRQKRVGRNKALFTILKFRTMRTDAPADTPTHLLSDPGLHITRIGRVLRKTSLDELPQVFNILAGHMSVIGPRPALYNQDDLVALRDKYCANGIRPGLTGLAQIKGRDELELDVKARLDGEYAAKAGFWLDVKIFFGTFFSVFMSKGMREGKAGTACAGTESPAAAGDNVAKTMAESAGCETGASGVGCETGASGGAETGVAAETGGCEADEAVPGVQQVAGYTGNGYAETVEGVREKQEVLV